MANGWNQNNAPSPAPSVTPTRFVVVTEGPSGDAKYSHFNDLDGAVEKAEEIVNERVTADVKIFQLLEIPVPAAAPALR